MTAACYDKLGRSLGWAPSCWATLCSLRSGAAAALRSESSRGFGTGTGVQAAGALVCCWTELP